MNIVEQAIKNNPERYSLDLEFDDNETIVLNFRDKEENYRCNWDLGFAYAVIRTYLGEPKLMFNLSRAMLESWVAQVKMYVVEIEKQLAEAETVEDLEVAKEKYNEMMNI